MNEVFPVVGGIIVGLVVGRLTVRRPPWLWVVVTVLLGVGATVVSGEWKVSWAYLLVDIPVVGLSAAAGYLVVCRVRMWELRLRRVRRFGRAP